MLSLLDKERRALHGGAEVGEVVEMVEVEVEVVWLGYGLDSRDHTFLSSFWFLPYRGENRRESPKIRPSCFAVFTLHSTILGLLDLVAAVYTPKKFLAHFYFRFSSLLEFHRIYKVDHGIASDFFSALNSTRFS